MLRGLDKNEIAWSYWALRQLKPSSNAIATMIAAGNIAARHIFTYQGNGLSASKIKAVKWHDRDIVTELAKAICRGGRGEGARGNQEAESRACDKRAADEGGRWIGLQGSRVV